MQGFESNVRGTWTLLQACLEHGVERVVFASSDKAYGAHDDAAVPRGLPAPADGSVRGLEGRGRPDRALLLALVRPARRGHPVREHLRRRRPQLLAPDPRGGERGARRPRARAALRRVARSATSSTSRTPRPRIWRSSTALDRDDVRGEAFNAGGGRSYPVGEVIALIAKLSGTGVEPDIRGTGNPEGEIDRQYVDPAKIRETPRLGARRGPRGGAGANDRLVPRPPGELGAGAGLTQAAELCARREPGSPWP